MHTNTDNGTTMADALAAVSATRSCASCGQHVARRTRIYFWDDPIWAWPREWGTLIGIVLFIVLGVAFTIWAASTDYATWFQAALVWYIGVPFLLWALGMILVFPIGFPLLLVFTTVVRSAQWVRNRWQDRLTRLYFEREAAAWVERARKLHPAKSHAERVYRQGGCPCFHRPYPDDYPYSDCDGSGPEIPYPRVHSAAKG